MLDIFQCYVGSSAASRLLLLLLRLLFLKRSSPIARLRFAMCRLYARFLFLSPVRNSQAEAEGSIALTTASLLPPPTEPPNLVSTAPAAAAAAAAAAPA